MRIAWASPWHARSAIATFGKDVTGVLCGLGHEVEVFRTEFGAPEAEPALEVPFPVHRLREIDPRSLEDGFDVVIAHLGDHFGFHGALVPLLTTTSPVVVFHDAFLANFCAGWAHCFPDPGGALDAMVAAAYGPPAGPGYWLPQAEMATRRPMVELFAQRALGAVVHGGHYRRRIAAACPGPVAQLSLSFRDLEVPAPRPRGDHLTIATVGHANANKRLAAVIEAIGASPRLRAACRYRVIGPIEPEERERIEAVMRAHGVTAVEFTGWIDDDALRAALAEVDVVSCLRFPILEGGSASTIVAMLSGRAVLVSDHGPYAEIPDDCVLKCAPGHEAADVRRHLEALLDFEPADLAALGARARAHALAAHSPERYARDLLALVAQAQPGGPLLRTGVQFGRVLGSFGLGPDSAAARSTAKALRALDRVAGPAESG